MMKFQKKKLYTSLLLFDVGFGLIWGMPSPLANAVKLRGKWLQKLDLHIMSHKKYGGYDEKKEGSIEKLIEQIRNRIFDRSYMEEYRTSEKAFTRKRKLTFVSLVLLQLNMLKRSLQKELVHFFDLIKSPVHITKSAFSQSRKQLKPEAFLDLNDTLVNGFYEEYDYQTWYGHRLLAIDGSTLNLPNSDEIIEYFGIQKNQTDIPLAMARISSCYDLLNEIIVEPAIAPYKMSEYELAVQHLEKLGREDLVVFDRGYGAIWLFFLLKRRGIGFITRIQKNLFPKIWGSEWTDKVITISTCSKESKEQIRRHGLIFKPIKVRIIKVKLNTGETEVLVTSLLDNKKYEESVFEQLYALRWGIEGKYNHLKNHVEIENFSGMSSIAVRQDFFANAFIENLRSIIARDAQVEVDAAKINAEHQYKVNRNLSLGFLKDELVRILMSDEPNCVEKIKKLFTLEPVSIRKGRHYDRKFHTSLRRFRMNYRRTL